MITLKYVWDGTRIRFEDWIKKEVKKWDVVELKNKDIAMWFQKNWFIEIKAELKKESKWIAKNTIVKKSLKTKKSK